jgi:hypothetical protein
VGGDLTQEEVAALVEHGRLFNFTHTWSRETGWVQRADAYVPTAAEVNAWQRRGGMGHDGINSGILIEARCKRMGVSHLCPVCRGEGDVPNPDERIRKLSEDWEDFDPPPGSGWQLWETTSEGSPISPVCASAEELARWCATNASIFASERLSYEEWLAMFRTGSDAVEMGSMVVGVAGGPIGSLAGQAAQGAAAQELIHDAAEAEEVSRTPSWRRRQPGRGRTSSGGDQWAS